MKIVYFGTPQFSAEVLEFLLREGIEIAGVVTRVDKPKGRTGSPVPSPVKMVAEQRGLPVFQPIRASSPESIERLKDWGADLFVVVAYGEILSQAVLNLPMKGCINLHTSLLPRYRGAAPIQQVILHGEKETGVSIIHMVKAMDAGDIITQKSVAIGETMTFGELEKALCEVGSELLLESIRMIDKGNAPRFVQDTELVTFAPKIELEDCEIDWSRSAESIHNLIRGVNPYPGAWCTVLVKGEPRRLKIWSSEVIDHQPGEPGKVLEYCGDRFVIGCGDRALRLLTLQLEGKRAMGVGEFMRGFSIPPSPVVYPK